MPTREVRISSLPEIRAMGGTGDADPLRVEGYAAVFGVNAQLPGFRERVKAGAFTNSIEKKADVCFLFNHDSNLLLGRTTTGSLTLRQDGKGLAYSCVLPNTQTARDVHELIKAGLITGCSFAFTIRENGQEWSESRDDDGTYFIQREISDTNLMDVSCVTWPCYSGTEVYARACAEPPIELRSAVEAKNKAFEIPVIIPPSVEKRPYASVADVPDSVPAAHKKQWMEVWNSVYAAAVKDGKSAKDAETAAFTQANGVIKKAEAKSTPVIPEKRDDETTSVVVEEEESFEDALKDINLALSIKYPAPDAVAPSIYGGRFYTCDTFEDYAIAVECVTGDHFKLSYDEDDDGNITFGDPQHVDQVWVPSDRCKKTEAEFRTKFSLVAKRMSGDESPEEAELEDEFDLGLIGRSYDEKSRHANHLEPLEHSGDCSQYGPEKETRCSCQNRFAPTGSGKRTDPLTEVESRSCLDAETDIEKRGGMTRTKRVAGKDLSAKSFAYVGDPDKTETWKLPIMDAAHVRNALARFGQTQGIPADKKAGVLAKIHAAAKRFGIDVAAEKKFAEEAAEKATARRWADVELAKITFDPTCTSVRYSPDQPRDGVGTFGEGSSNKESVHDHAMSKHLSAADAHDAAAKVASEKFNAKSAAAHQEAAVSHRTAAAAHGVAKKAAISGAGYKDAANNANDASAEAYRCSGRCESV